MSRNRILRSTQNSARVHKMVKDLVEEKFGGTHGVLIFYEHGQWWVTAEDLYEPGELRSYSVVDAAPGLVHGLDLEEV